jgi:hypothetical protein
MRAQRGRTTRGELPPDGGRSELGAERDGARGDTVLGGRLRGAALLTCGVRSKRLALGADEERGDSVLRGGTVLPGLTSRPCEELGGLARSEAPAREPPVAGATE